MKGISSIGHLSKLSFEQWSFWQWSFWQLVILATGHFGNWSFWQLVI
jgi:hypothetical protein